MNFKKSDFHKQKYQPQREKNIVNALAHRIAQEFPRIGGQRIRNLCAQMILEVVYENLKPLEYLRHGQAIWMAVSIDDPPQRRKPISETDLVPVILDLCSLEDIDAVIARRPRAERLISKLIRLCRQAYDQGGLLGNCDLALLLNLSETDVGRMLARYERENQLVIPRRATIHDVGSGLTHKKIICWKRYAEGKSTDQITKETYHSLEAVDRYLGLYDRVRHCKEQNLTIQETAFTLNCSVNLVNQYLEIDSILESQDD